MKKFNLTEELTKRRESVIAKYNSLTAEKFYDGCSLRTVMVEVLQMCQMNRIASAKTLDAKLPFFMSNVYVQHSRIQAEDKLTAALKAKYQGTAFMAMV